MGVHLKSRVVTPYLIRSAMVTIHPSGSSKANSRMTAGEVEIFFNGQKAVAEDYPPLAARPAGGALTLFLEVEGIEESLSAVQKSKARIVMPLKTQFYGMREFVSFNFG